MIKIQLKSRPSWACVNYLLKLDLGQVKLHNASVECANQGKLLINKMYLSKKKKKHVQKYEEKNISFFLAHRIIKIILKRKTLIMYYYYTYLSSGQNNFFYVYAQGYVVFLQI